MKRHSLFRGAIVSASSAFLLLLLVGVVAAQQGTSSVRGTVTDPQGKVVAGATVTLINPTTSVSRNATTNDTGVYSFDLVAVGDYRVEVEAQGFKKAILTDVHALVSKVVPVDVQLEIGNVAETVTVA